MDWTLWSLAFKDCGNWFWGSFDLTRRNKSHDNQDKTMCKQTVAMDNYLTTFQLISRFRISNFFKK